MAFSPRFSHRRFSPAQGWHGALHYAPVTICLLIISCAVMILSHLGKDHSRLDFLFFSSKRDVIEQRAALEQRSTMDPTAAATAAELAKPFRLIEKGHYWRLITPIFLHFGILHLAFNLMWLWQFGLVLETRYGSARFTGLVALLAIVSNSAQAYFFGFSFGGLSGVNYGLLGFLLAYGKLHPQPFWSFHRSTVSLLLAWLVLGFTGLAGPIANGCHLAGFLCGCVIGGIVAFRTGAWKVLARRQQFRQQLRSSDTALHRCATCGRTEVTHPSLAFYVHPADGEEYCEDHLPPLPGQKS